MTNAVSDPVLYKASCHGRRVAGISDGDPAIEGIIRQMVDISIHALPTMYSQELGHFGYTRRRNKDGVARLAGSSIRYSAIVVLGAMYLPEAQQRQVLLGRSAREFCTRLCSKIDQIDNLGDAAILTWAAAETQLVELLPVVERMEQLLSADRRFLTVEAAWVLSAQTAVCLRANIRPQPKDTISRLLSAFNPDTGIFSCQTNAQCAPWYRAHVACFADQIYPIQALARYHKAFSCDAALDAANHCAAQICQLQGPAGQWWWHYDARTGAVIEGYPVYSVHQDGMAPMALMDLHEAGGTNHGSSIRLGLEWMRRAPEVGRSLIDEESKLIWRKVARREPRKMTRAIRALVSRNAPNLRLRGLDWILRPQAIDFECRPYHLAWILFAWLGGLQ